MMVGDVVNSHNDEVMEEDGDDHDRSHELNRQCTLASSYEHAYRNESHCQHSPAVGKLVVDSINVLSKHAKYSS